jgi:hypothetical protein
MKNIALLLLAILIFSGCQTTSQSIPNQTNHIVISVEGKSSEEIYTKLRQWFSQSFVSGEAVIDYEDKKEGTIIGNAYGTYGSDFIGIIEYYMKYQIRVDVKDGRFRVETTILSHRNQDTSKSYDVARVSLKRHEKAQNYLKEITLDMKSFVDNRYSKENLDW